MHALLILDIDTEKVHQIEGKNIYWGTVNVEIISDIICLGASSKLNRKWILASGRGLGSWSHSRTTPLMDNSKSGNDDQIPGKENFKKQASILQTYAYAGAVWITLQEQMLEDIKAYKITFRP